MNIEKLKNYEKLYKSCEFMGSARILRNYLQLESSFPIPLSIAHGVDMNQMSGAMDVQSAEPIHWSINNLVHERAAKVKPSIKIPHPWLILKSTRLVKSGAGILIIGPPPGKSNDNALLSCLKSLKINSYDLLLKYRGQIDLSKKFWESNGVNVVTAGPTTEFFYDRLFDLLESYEYVIGCTLSSALFFAASIGRKCELIEDYTYSAYESPNYLECVDFTSPVCKKFVNLLKVKNYLAASNMASDVLGSAFFTANNQLKVRLREELISAIDSLEYPVHFKNKTGFIDRNIILFISLWFRKTGLISFGFSGYFRRHIKNQVSVISINEIDVWINGLNNKNFQIEKIQYKRNVTQLGWAVD